MQRIQNITSVPYQKQTFILGDGTSVSITIKFIEMQQGWWITELIWGAFRLTGLRISNGPNILYQWRNLIPFGIMCTTEEGREPGLQQDFESGASKLFILDRGEVEAYREFLLNG